MPALSTGQMFMGAALPASRNRVYRPESCPCAVRTLCRVLSGVTSEVHSTKRPGQPTPAPFPHREPDVNPGNDSTATWAECLRSVVAAQARVEASRNQKEQRMKYRTKLKKH